MAKLYIVPTPIGNLRDMTFRAVDVLKSVQLILAEDTRTSKFLCQHYSIETPLQAYHKDNEHKEIGRFLFDLKSDSFIFEDKDSKQYYTCGSKCRYLLFNLEGPAYIDKKDATNNRYHIDLYDEFENPTDKDMILKFAEQIKNERNS